MTDYVELRNKLAAYLTTQQVDKIFEAYQVAYDAHHGQLRVSGEPYIVHPMAVADILADLHLDHQSIEAAILHDVIEDTPLDKSFITNNFGEKVAELVDGVSKLAQIKFESREEAQAENFRKMMLAMAKDIRVILIKMADRLHNMRTIEALAMPRKKRIARETLEIYAPIAHRLGMHAFRVEFEDLSFKALYPLRYRVLKNALKQGRGHRKEILSSVKKAIRFKLEDFSLIHFRLLSRKKHLYSLYKKMRKKRLSLTEILDVYGLRVVVATHDECYRVLGVVHELFKPVTGRFKDYIAIPKANGYQSIHTTVIGPFGAPIEIQIRTEDMNRIAENGIASHWVYKAEPSIDESDAQIRAREWLKGLLEIQSQTGNSLEFIENVKIDLYPDEVYVFTPKSKILSLPQGATPVDFAYIVHTDVGNQCVACKIDRRLAPLSTRLISGQTVEIITAPGAHPNPAWLSFAVTGKARSNIRHWLKNQKVSESQELGRRLLNSALAVSNLSIDSILKAKVKQFLTQCELQNIEQLFEEIGLGLRMAALVAQRLVDEHSIQSPELHEAHQPAPLIIKGTEGMVVAYATCCYPIPGDAIIGLITEGKGIMIHTENCVWLQEHRPKREKSIHVQWEDKLEGEFKVEVSIDVINGRGVLATLASTLAETNSNIINVRVDERDGRHNTIYFILAVRDRAHLARVMRRLRKLPIVTRIARCKSSH